MQRHVTQLQVMSMCQLALSKGVRAFVLCVNQWTNIPTEACKQGRLPPLPPTPSPYHAASARNLSRMTKL